MRQADLHSAEQRGNPGAVSWQGGQEARNDGSRGDRGLQGADERISVDGLDHLGLCVQRDKNLQKTQSDLGSALSLQTLSPTDLAISTDSDGSAGKCGALSPAQDGRLLHRE